MKFSAKFEDLNLEPEPLHPESKSQMKTVRTPGAPLEAYGFKVYIGTINLRDWIETLDPDP